MSSSPSSAAANAAAAASNDELWGWFAAVCSMLAFGSFGVPIKSRASRSVDVDPLVFQSYKTGVCFLTSWLVLLSHEQQPFTYTPWGIVSGLFWVPGGVATVYAVQTVGLAVAIGLGSSCIVLVSFVWGIFVFQESVQSKLYACFAVFLISFGIIGMAYYGTPQTNQPTQQTQQQQQQQQQIISTTSSTQTETKTDIYQQLQLQTDIDDQQQQNYSDGIITQSQNDHNLIEPFQDEPGMAITPSSSSLMKTTRISRNDHDDHDHDSSDDDGILTMENVHDDDDDENSNSNNTVLVPTTKYISICGIRVKERTLGLCAAVFNGVWGGSIMVPMHWAGPATSGIGYVISFAIGASVVTLLLWAVRWVRNVLRHDGSLRDAYSALPGFHFRTMWLPGGLSGLLWSIGNFFSVVSVRCLGEATGYSVIQAAMLVSGLWGIFYFREVTGRRVIMKWFVAACITVSGILLLSYEHHNG